MSPRRLGGAGVVVSVPDAYETSISAPPTRAPATRRHTPAILRQRPVKPRLTGIPPRCEPLAEGGSTLRLPTHNPLRPGSGVLPSRPAALTRPPPVTRRLTGKRGTCTSVQWNSPSSPAHRCACPAASVTVPQRAEAPRRPCARTRPRRPGPAVELHRGAGGVTGRARRVPRCDPARVRAPGGVRARRPAGSPWYRLGTVAAIRSAPSAAVATGPYAGGRGVGVLSTVPPIARRGHLRGRSGSYRGRAPP